MIAHPQVSARPAAVSLWGVSCGVGGGKEEVTVVYSQREFDCQLQIIEAKVIELFALVGH